MIFDLGLVDYEEAYKVQKDLVSRRKTGEIGDSLIFCEHKPVFTIGRTGSTENILTDRETLQKKDIKVLNVDRGGDVTFHGPGQLVVYPIVNLKERTKDLHRYLRQLEDTVIAFLNKYSVRAGTAPDRTGVWVDNKKIASIGIGAADWVTYHGVGININTDLAYFSMINPCGLKDIKATSLSEVLGREINVRDVKGSTIEQFKSSPFMA